VVIFHALAALHLGKSLRDLTEDWKGSRDNLDAAKRRVSCSYPESKLFYLLCKMMFPVKQ
jgi:hypothetical protein